MRLYRRAGPIEQTAVISKTLRNVATCSALRGSFARRSRGDTGRSVDNLKKSSHCELIEIRTTIERVPALGMLRIEFVSDAIS